MRSHKKWQPAAGPHDAAGEQQPVAEDAAAEDPCAEDAVEASRPEERNRRRTRRRDTISSRRSRAGRGRSGVRGAASTAGTTRTSVADPGHRLQQWSTRIRTHHPVCAQTRSTTASRRCRRSQRTTRKSRETRRVSSPAPGGDRQRGAPRSVGGRGGRTLQEGERPTAPH